MHHIRHRDRRQTPTVQGPAPFRLALDLENSRLLTIPKACLTATVTRAEWDTANFHSGFCSGCKSMHEKEQTLAEQG